jgi:hypothetical protein
LIELIQGSTSCAEYSDMLISPILYTQEVVRENIILSIPGDATLAAMLDEVAQDNLFMRIMLFILTSE